MPTLDTTATTAVAGDIAPAWFVWIDIVGDPIRVTTFGSTLTFGGTGDADLDGNTFTAFAGQFLDVGDVNNSDSGSDTLTLTLSGIVALDATLLAAIGDVTKWQGRTCRVWFELYDSTGTTVQGGVVQHYTGYLSSVTIIPGQKSQTIQLSVENYLAAFNQPSNRTYLRQSDYDAADTSAAATIAASNGSMRGGIGKQGASSGIAVSTGSGGAGGLSERTFGASN